MRGRLMRVVAAAALVAQSLLIGPAVPAVAKTSSVFGAPAAATSTVRLRVESARAWVPAGLTRHEAIPHYHWLIVRDDTGETNPHYGRPGVMAPGNADFDCLPPTLGGDPAYPDNCRWSSIRAITGGTSGQIFASGDDSTFSQTNGLTLPAGKYMISVKAEPYKVDGFKIDGQWFTVPMADPGLVTVAAQPYPLPLTTLRMRVFNDTSLNGEYDTGEPGLAGFEVHISDVLGEVSTDWFGNPLCTEYRHDGNGNIIFDVNGRPTIQTPGGKCRSNANGDVVIKYLGPNRYSAIAVPPNDGQTWFQTSSLEGGHDWDIWAIEGWDGFDPERVVYGEPFPFSFFAFVKSTSHPGDATAPTTSRLTEAGAIRGVGQGMRPFSPPAGGIPFGGEAGNELVIPTALDAFAQDVTRRPPARTGVVFLTDLLNNDQLVWAGLINPDGTFQINHVADGDYAISTIDINQNYLLETTATKVVNGQVTDMGVLDQFPWFSTIEGTVCNDLNRNGKCDAGEPGIPGLKVQLLSRDNSLQDQGSNTATSDATGRYVLRQAYPLLQWVVAQLYDERFYTVGVTYQASNNPSDTTVMANGGFVDVSVFNSVGQKTRMDWAIHRYEFDPALGPTNGGIVGEVIYDSTRNEQDARLEKLEDYEAGIPGVNVHLFAPVPCDPVSSGPLCVLTSTPSGSSYYLTNGDGSYKKGFELNDPYVTEEWLRPINCVARDVHGRSVQQRLLPPPNSGTGCIEAPLMANQIGNNSLVDRSLVQGRGQYVNGNYGFTTITRDSVTGLPIAEREIPPGDYLVEIDLPRDPFTGGQLLKPTKEEDINVFTGDVFIAPGETPLVAPTAIQSRRTTPQPAPQIPPAPCTGPLHTVHVVDDPALARWDPADPANPNKTGVFNPGFLGAGGSYFEGRRMPLCTSRLVTVQRGRSTTPSFHLFSDVPLPGRIRGLVTDDLNLTTNPRELMYGEKAGLGNIPIGIYDWDNRWLTTIHTDPNGIYEVILPSTSSYNCPLPAGPCPGVFRLVANDPGQPSRGRANPDYNPQYRTLSIFQQVWPALTLPSDLAPLPMATAVEGPGTQMSAMPRCALNDAAQTRAPKVPELYAVSRPYGNPGELFTITGQYFGRDQEDGRVTLDGLSLAVTSWTDRLITARVPATLLPGPHQLLIQAENGERTVNGLTFHILGTVTTPAGTIVSYTPTIFEVGAGRAYDPTSDTHALQRAIEAAAPVAKALVVVYPGATGQQWNPLRAYFENLVIHSPLKLQGIGPGGVYADGTVAPGSVIDGTGFGLDTEKTTAWETLVAQINATGPILTHPTPPAPVPPTGETIFVVATAARPFTEAYKGAIDGLAIQGGDTLNFVAVLNDDGGGPEPGLFDPIDPFFATGTPIQGGGVVAWAWTTNLQVTNNIIRSNSGAYGGGVTLGTAYVGDNHLDGIRIGHNRIFANGGSNLAGQVGIFAGADGYEVDHNDICGGFSAEYGGGISHFGLSNHGKIHDNRIYFNGSYDEGAGVMVGGELPLPAGAHQRTFDDQNGPPPPPSGLSPGSGEVDIYNNIIQSNLSGDDGGGLRLLMNGDYLINVYNNFLVNNIAAHEGGGIALDDATNVRFFNNTVMKNLTTATAITSDGKPAPAGLSTMRNSVNLQHYLENINSPNKAYSFSNPLMFNNVFCDNRAGRWDGANIIGIKYVNVAGEVDPNAINYWDMGVVDLAGLLKPTYSVLQPTSNPGVVADASNLVCPSDLATLIKAPYDTSIKALPWRGDAHFVGNVLIALDVPPALMGNYHLSGETSIANNAGIDAKAGVKAPAFDIDNQRRPSQRKFEIGADELPPFIEDDFERPDGALGLAWLVTPQGGVTILGRQARVATLAAAALWDTAFGNGQAAFLTLTKLPTPGIEGVLLKYTGPLPTSGTMPTTTPGTTMSGIAVTYAQPTNKVFVTTYDSTQGPVLRASFSATFAAGDVLEARALADGTVTVFKNGTLIGTTNVVTTAIKPWPAARAAAGGRTGVIATSGVQFDDFGGGDLSQ